LDVHAFQRIKYCANMLCGERPPEILRFSVSNLDISRLFRDFPQFPGRGGVRLRVIALARLMREMTAVNWTIYE
jgi:hypothetical protein